jgi:hypothetical protein
VSERTDFRALRREALGFSGRVGTATVTGTPDIATPRSYAPSASMSYRPKRNRAAEGTGVVVLDHEGLRFLLRSSSTAYRRASNPPV